MIKHGSLILCFFFTVALSFTSAGERHLVPKKACCVAHRGFSYVTPENTMIAFKMAIQSGADYTETDIYKTSDGVLVLLHDPNLKRTTGKDIDVRNITYAELEKLEAGAWKGKHFTGEKIPTLEECLKLFKGSGCRPALEIKMDNIEQDVVDLLRKMEMIDDVTILDFNNNRLARFREIEPKLETAWNFSRKLDGDPAKFAEALCKELDENAKKSGTEILSLNLNVLSPQLIEMLHAKDYVIWGWPGNDVPLMNKLLHWGVDAITTDRPDMLVEVLKNREGKK